MNFELGFLEEALKEWRKFDRSTRDQFKSNLSEHLSNPRVPSAKLAGHKDRYQIKLRSVGYRLEYEVRDNELIVIAVAVRKRERNAVYLATAKRQFISFSYGFCPSPKRKPPCPSFA